MSAIRPAATVVLLRECVGHVEVLLLRRNKAVQFAGGLWVFPGGALDVEDFAGDANNAEAAARRAAVREAREETGLDITDCSLQYFAHWTTPEHEVKRYATWFYVAVLPKSEANICIDNSEIVDYRWLEPSAALAMHHAGELEMMPPTYVTLTELATCKTTAEVAVMYQSRPPLEILPKFIFHANGKVALYPDDAGYEMMDPNRQGSRHRCYRAEDGWHYECDI